MTLDQIIDSTKELLDRIGDLPPVYAVTLQERTVDGIFANVTLQFSANHLQPAPRGALLDLAYRLELTEVDLDPSDLVRRVTGKFGDATVELFA